MKKTASLTDKKSGLTAQVQDSFQKARKEYDALIRAVEIASPLYYTKKNVPYVREINVTEHRAPTDESVRLLNEFEEKARENIINKIKVNDNTLNIVSVAYQDDQITRELKVHIKFSINGKEYLIKTVIDENKKFSTGTDLSKIIFETISQNIIKKLVTENETFVELLKFYKPF